MVILTLGIYEIKKKINFVDSNILQTCSRKSIHIFNASVALCIEHVDDISYMEDTLKCSCKNYSSELGKALYLSEGVKLQNRAHLGRHCRLHKS
jgi:hypothetical protein